MQYTNEELELFNLEYIRAGFHCPIDGVYQFGIEDENGDVFELIEEFVNRKPIGKNGSPLGKIIRFSMIR